MTTYRSNKSAVAAAEAAGFTADQVTITKLATAKYELVLPEAPVADKPAKAPKAPKAARINRHWNDDGSLTLYHMGLKLRRLGGEDNEEASEEELEDTEGYAEKYLSRKFPKNSGGWVWGSTTQGHNWHTKRAKALRAQIAALAEAGKDTAELEAKLAQLKK